ncbi:MAG: ABC transporter ATP-binding protein, partial [Bacilli bacterium]
VEGRVSLHKEIRKLKSAGRTIIMATHDMAEVEALCDKLAILKDGKINDQGSHEVLLKKNKEYKKLYEAELKTNN